MKMHFKKCLEVVVWRWLQFLSNMELIVTQQHPARTMNSKGATRRTPFWSCKDTKKI